MSNFLLKDPACVLIHIPKTGGSTIRRGIWESRYEGPEFGNIPASWEPYFKFAFVRHPLDRLVSAWADFTQLRGFKGSIEDFIEIVLDESTIFDERRSTTSESIRHHTIPQTHPFNCLALAEFVGRHETFMQDLGYVLDKAGMPKLKIPTLRETKHGGWRSVLSGGALTKAIMFYEEDFEALDYVKP